MELCSRLFQKCLADPFEAVPAADEDEASDVLIEGEDCPHGDESPTESDSEDVASDHLYAPHHDDSDNYREIDVACASEGIHTEEVEGTAVFKQYLHPEYHGSSRYDPRV